LKLIFFTCTKICYIFRPVRIHHFYMAVLFGVWYTLFSVIYWAAGGVGICRYKTTTLRSRLCLTQFSFLIQKQFCNLLFIVKVSGGPSSFRLHNSVRQVHLPDSGLGCPSRYRITKRMNVVFEKNKFLKHRCAGNAILIVVGGMICMPLLQVHGEQ